MPRRWTRVAIFGAGFILSRSVPLESQQPVPHRALLHALRDTVTNVEAAVSGFNRDLRSAGPETVLARAAFLRTRCQSAIAVLGRAGVEVRAEGGARRSSAKFIQAVERLSSALTGECEAGFRTGGPGSWADTLRAWGPYRGKQIAEAIRAYETAASTFAASLGFRLAPRLP